MNRVYPTKKHIDPKYSSKAPVAIGPYSQANIAGNMIFVSGQLPLDVKTGEFAGKTIKEQTRQSLENVKAILEEAGFTMDDVVKTTVLLDDITEFAAMNEAYAGYFTANCPARAAYEAAKLPLAQKWK